MEPRERRTALVIGGLYFVRMLGLFMLLPVMALGAEQLPGATPLLIGAALGIYGLSQAILQVPLGMLSDRVGRKPVLLGALGVFVLGSLVAALAPDIAWLITGRALQGCGAIAGTLLALMSDLTRVEQRAKAMAMVGGFISLAFGLSMVAGPLVFAYGGLGSVFWVTATAGVIAIVLVLLVIPTPVVVTHNLDATVDVGRLGDVGGRDFLPLYLGIFCLHGIMMALFVVLPDQLLGFGVPVTRHALVYLVILLLAVALMIPLMLQSGKAARVLWIYRAGVVLICTGCLVMASAGSRWVLYAGLVVFFTGFNLLEVVIPALLSRVAPAGARGAAMGVYATCQFGGVFVGGAFGGWLAGEQAAAGVMVVMAGVAGVWLLVTLLQRQPENSSSRSVNLSDVPGGYNNQLREQLLSLDGVIDVVMTGQDQVAYLKVLDDEFNDANLEAVLNRPGEEN